VLIFLLHRDDSRENPFTYAEKPPLVACSCRANAFHAGRGACLVDSC